MNIFISCVKRKKDLITEAENLYDSTFFKYCLKYAKSFNTKNIFILSAKYGLLNLNDIISPYDLTLKKMNKKEKNIWENKVINQCKNNNINFNDKTIWLCGKEYRKNLINYFPNSYLPLADKGGIGNQIKFMKNFLEKQTKERKKNEENN